MHARQKQSGSGVMEEARRAFDIKPSSTALESDSETVSETDVSHDGRAGLISLLAPFGFATAKALRRYLTGRLEPDGERAKPMASTRHAEPASGPVRSEGERQRSPSKKSALCILQRF